MNQPLSSWEHDAQVRERLTSIRNVLIGILLILIGLATLILIGIGQSL